MRKFAFFFAFVASTLLLATPIVWACDEMVSPMLGCAPTEAACHEAEQASIDCCFAHPDPEPELFTILESASVVLPLEPTSHAQSNVLAEHSAATEPRFSHWRGDGYYVLFSSFLL